MGLVKITFDGSSVSAKQDADMNHFLCSCIPAGVIEGLANELSVSVANNYITFKSGYVQIYGRRIYVEDDSQVYISLDSTKYGYIVIDVDLNKNSVDLKAVETSSTYPSLTQQDLSKYGTRYQFPIAKYQKTSSSITLVTFDRTVMPKIANYAASKASEVQSYIYNNYKPNRISYKSRVGNVYRYDMSAYNMSRILVIVPIGTSFFIPIPGNVISGNSMFGVPFRYLGTDYSLSCEWLPGSEFLVSIGNISSSLSINTIHVITFGK